MTNVRLWIALASLVVLTSLSGGCLFAADALNPNVLTSLGISPSSISRGGGRVVVVFDNQTDQLASFTAVLLDNANNPTQARELGRENVPAGETANVVLDCPVGVVFPGRLGDGLEVEAVGAIVDPAGAATEVEYAGSALASGVDFRCGDVIVIALEPGGGDAEFRITVRVIPGR